MFGELIHSCATYTKQKKHIKKAKTFWKANSKQQNFPKQVASEAQNLKSQVAEHEKLFCDFWFPVWHLRNLEVTTSP